MDMACAWRVHGMRMVYASGSGSRSAAALHWKWRVEAAALCGVEVAVLVESRLQTHGAQAATPRVAGQAAREADPDPERNPNPEQDQLLVKKFSEAKRTAEAERESQAQQVATAQVKLSKKESEVNSKGEEVNRLRAELEEKEDEVRKGDPVWLTPGFDFAARAAEADRELEEARSAGADNDTFLASFMTDMVDHATNRGACGVCKQQCGEPQIEHMRKKQKKYQEMGSVPPAERAERIRQKSELAR